MKRIKTSELTGATLDWAVAKCEGYDYEVVDGALVTGEKRFEAESANDFYGCEFDVCTNHQPAGRKVGRLLSAR